MRQAEVLLISATFKETTAKKWLSLLYGYSRMLYLAASLAAQPVNPTPGKPDVQRVMYSGGTEQ